MKSGKSSALQRSIFCSVSKSHPYPTYLLNQYCGFKSHPEEAHGFLCVNILMHNNDKHPPTAIMMRNYPK